MTKKRKTEDPVVALVPLTITDIAWLRGGLESSLYWDSEDCYRNNGFPLDPRNCSGFDPNDVSEDAREQIRRLDFSDRLDQLLREHQELLAAQGEEVILLEDLP